MLRPKYDTRIAVDILYALKKHGFSPKQKEIVKAVFDTNNMDDFNRWLAKVRRENEASSYCN